MACSKFSKTDCAIMIASIISLETPRTLTPGLIENCMTANSLHRIELRKEISGGRTLRTISVLLLGFELWRRRFKPHSSRPTVLHPHHTFCPSVITGFEMKKLLSLASDQVDVIGGNILRGEAAILLCIPGAVPSEDRSVERESAVNGGCRAGR